MAGMPGRKTNLMLPIMDLSNHRYPCPVTLRVGRYLGEWDEDAHLVATEDIRAGDELCCGCCVPCCGGSSMPWRRAPCCVPRRVRVEVRA